MSKKELSRLEVIQRLERGLLQQREASRLLGISERQVKRLLRNYRDLGAEGLISKSRGKASNHQLPVGIGSEAAKLIAEHYRDFGPTLASEYLQERHGIKLCVETTRQVMIKHELWNPKREKKVRIHQQRERRECFGELVQLDGSHHDWFEGRAPKCCLLVLIDDATSKLVGLRFERAETTHGYFTVVNEYFSKYGLPMSFYGDKHGVFRVNAKEAESGTGLTQFGRAMEQLGIELLHAQTAQAKGRVERVNSTLQDRLVKAMRIDGINSIEAGNAYLEGYIEKFNKQFSQPAKSGANAHCELQLENGALDHILSQHSERLLSKNLECSYNNVIYQIQAQDKRHRLQHKKVLICEDKDGSVTLFYNGDLLIYKTLDKRNQPQTIADDKTLNAEIDDIKVNRCRGHKPAPNHPWRQQQNRQYRLKKLSNIKAAAG